MTKIFSVLPEYVDLTLEKLEFGKLYISKKYNIATHLCCCGCGKETVTPLEETGWKLIENSGVSLSPSIRNFNFHCKSHYFVKNNQIEWL